MVVGITADWHLDLLDLPTVERQAEYDPLTDPSYAPPIPPIDLSTARVDLDGYLDGLLKQEASLFQEGVTCPIKDSPDGTCLACPVSAARNYSDPLGKLCRVGQEQERVATVLIAQRHGLQ